MKSRTATLRQAEIKPEVIRYHLWGVAITCTLIVVTIPLLPIILPVAYWLMKRYYARLEVVLTRRDLKVRRGIWNVEEKSVPLEKITDLALNQGPLMRLFDIKGMRVETAGQSSEGALVSITGIDEVDAFRDAVLDQRDRISDWQDDATETPRPGAADGTAGDSLAVLGEIRDSLARIESHLAGREKDDG